MSDEPTCAEKVSNALQKASSWQMAETMPVTTLLYQLHDCKGGNRSPEQSVCYCHHNHGATQALNAESSGKLTGSYRDPLVTAHRDRLQIVALMSID
jgi:hypothetical protein